MGETEERQAKSERFCALGVYDVLAVNFFNGHHRDVMNTDTNDSAGTTALGLVWIADWPHPAEVRGQFFHRPHPLQLPFNVGVHAVLLLNRRNLSPLDVYLGKIRLPDSDFAAVLHAAEPVRVDAHCLGAQAVPTSFDNGLAVKNTAVPCPGV